MDLPLLTSNCILQILSTFRHGIEIPPTVLTVTLMSTYISYVVDARKTTLHRLTSWKRRLTSAKCQNDVGTAADI